jgi:AraC family transcriptional regulator of adaptative response / DNA-3-methyladenine glycosylase II
MRQVATRARTQRPATGEGDTLGLDRAALDRARMSRDPRFDGKFFIAVTSTGIYCRPICPVRSPKATNIRYFATAAAAAAAGFRPCLRCRAEAAPGTPAWSGTSTIVRRALKLIDDGVLDHGSVDQLADHVGIGPRHLHRLFLEHVGASPTAVAQTRRLNFAKRLLDETRLPISDIVAAAGFSSVRRFNAAIRNAYQRSPRELRKSHRDDGANTGDWVILRLTFRPPYDWAHMHNFLAAHAVPGIERVHAWSYARTVALPEGDATVCVRVLDDENALELRVRGVTPAALFRLSTAAQRAFDLAADPVSITRALSEDALLGPLVKRRPGLRIPGVWDPFECAVRAILGQQVSVASGRTLAGRLVEHAGRAIAGGTDGLTHVFPSPAALATTKLDGLGIPRTRVGALGALARAVVDGVVNFDAPVNQVREALVALPGVGRWTAEYVALRALNEPDAFPPGDLILRRVAGGTDAALTETALEARAETWRPWRGYAAVHLWAHARPAYRALIRDAESA